MPCYFIIIMEVINRMTWGGLEKEGKVLEKSRVMGKTSLENRRQRGFFQI